MKKNNIDITIKKSNRAKRLRLTVECDGEVVLTKPKGATQREIHAFIEMKRDWIINKHNRMKRLAQKNEHLTRRDNDHYEAHKHNALSLAKRKVHSWNNEYNYEFNTIRVKSMKTLWGSCTPKNNLHFNYKILFIPEGLQDYIIVHELCHLRERNHQKRFWQLVERTLPDWKQRRGELKKLL